MSIIALLMYPVTASSKLGCCLLILQSLLTISLFMKSLKLYKLQSLKLELKRPLGSAYLFSAVYVAISSFVKLFSPSPFPSPIPCSAYDIFLVSSNNLQTADIISYHSYDITSCELNSRNCFIFLEFCSCFDKCCWFLHYFFQRMRELGIYNMIIFYLRDNYGLS